MKRNWIFFCHQPHRKPINTRRCQLINFKVIVWTVSFGHWHVNHDDEPIFGTKSKTKNEIKLILKKSIILSRNCRRHTLTAFIKIAVMILVREIHKEWERECTSDGAHHKYVFVDWIFSSMRAGKHYENKTKNAKRRNKIINKIEPASIQSIFGVQCVSWFLISFLINK